jgi:uncharacterized protein (TIGR00299 family) protein
MTRVAIVECASGIAGDMMLGALLDVGLDPEWLRALPAQLKLDGVAVRMERVKRAEIACWKVDFDIPPQPHGRHLKHIVAIVNASSAPARVKEKANRAFELLTAAEAEVHGTTIEKVHLHEVGAVDAILDVVGSIWGLDTLNVDAVHCGVIALGDGTVQTAHGAMAVPTPATIRLLAGMEVRPGPEGSGELTTPTGAVLLKILASQGLPQSYRPIRTGYGGGTKDFKDRANVVRLTIADVEERHGTTERLVMLACDVDDMEAEYLAAAADALRSAGALDVTLSSVLMKKGRAGTRIEVLTTVDQAAEHEQLLFEGTTTIGVRRTDVFRTALPRQSVTIDVFGEKVAIKRVTLRDGSTRAKPEFDDIWRVALATGRSTSVVRDEVLRQTGGK